MGDRDARYLLCDLVEIDNVLLDVPLTGAKGGTEHGGRMPGGHKPAGHNFAGIGPGGEENGSIPVIAGVALGITGYPRHIKMVVVEKNENFPTAKFIQRKIDEGAVIHRKLHNVYEKYAEILPWYQKKYFAENEVRRHLNRIRMAASKAEAFLAETYHRVSKKHLQAYLNEFCYRYCRRRDGGQLFNRLLTACALTGTVTYAELMK